MTTANDTTLNRIRALLAKAEGAATQDEADAYNEKASEMMARHGVEQAALSHQRGNDTPTDRKVVVENPYSMRKASLLGGVAEAMRCRTVRIRSRQNQGGTQTMHVFGYESDIDRAMVLYTSLLLQMSNGAKNVQAPRGGTRSYRNSWMVGFTSRVTERLREIENAAAAEERAAGTGTDLVLADRTKRVEQARKAQYPKLRKSTTRYRADGYNGGRAAGDRADIGQTRVGGSRQALPR